MMITAKCLTCSGPITRSDAKRIACRACWWDSPEPADATLLTRAVPVHFHFDRDAARVVASMRRVAPTVDVPLLEHLSTLPQLDGPLVFEEGRWVAPVERALVGVKPSEQHATDCDMDACTCGVTEREQRLRDGDCLDCGDALGGAPRCLRCGWCDEYNRLPRSREQLEHGAALTMSIAYAGIRAAFHKRWWGYVKCSGCGARIDSDDEARIREGIEVLERMTGQRAPVVSMASLSACCAAPRVWNGYSAPDEVRSLARVLEPDE